MKRSLTNQFDSALELDFTVEYSEDPADSTVGIFITEMIIERVMLGSFDILEYLSDQEIKILESEAYEHWSDRGKE